MEYFVWIKGPTGKPSAQLWAHDYSDGIAPYYRQDCHREISESILLKIKLPLTEKEMSFEDAKRKYPLGELDDSK